MDKILICSSNKEIENKIGIALCNDFFTASSYLDEYNYISIINQQKPNTIIILASDTNYIMLSKLCATKKLIILIKDKEYDLSGLKDLDNFYYIPKIRVENILEYVIILNKSYKNILSLKNKIESYKDKEEEARLLKRAKLYIMKKGVSEEEAYKYIIDYSMKNRISKKEASLRILNE